MTNAHLYLYDRKLAVCSVNLELSFVGGTRRGEETMKRGPYAGCGDASFGSAGTRALIQLRVYWTWLGPWQIVLAFWLVPLLATAQTQPDPTNAAGGKVVEVHMLDSSQPATVMRAFHVSWQDAPVTVKGLVLNWKGPGQALAAVPPKVAAAKDATEKDVVRVEITFRDIKGAGVYSGQLVLMDAGGSGEKKTYELTFVATFKPSVIIAPTGNLALKVSNCNFWCWLTEPFAPETKASQYAFQVKNASPAPVDVHVRFAALGATSIPPALSLSMDVTGGTQSTALDIKDVLPNETKTIYATVAEANKLSAGAYTGPLQFTAIPSSVRGMSEGLVGKSGKDGTYEIQNVWRDEVSSTVSVKSSVVWALLVVVLGLCVGRVAATLATAGFEQKLKYFPLFQELSDAIRKFPEVFRSTIDFYLKEAWSIVLAGGDAKVIEQNFATLGKQVALAANFFSLEEKILALPDDKRKQAQEKFNTALTELEKRSPKIDDVIALRRELLLILNEDQPSDSNVRPDSTMDLKLQRWEATPPSRLAQTLAFVAGTGTAGVGLYYRYLRPLMYLVVMFVLVIYGLWQNYSTGAEAATFGAQGISQYAALFLWGVTTDIVNKTLQQLSLKDISFKRM